MFRGPELRLGPYFYVRCTMKKNFIIPDEPIKKEDRYFVAMIERFDYMIELLEKLSITPYGELVDKKGEIVPKSTKKSASKKKE
jgi:hypothetical protein